MDTEERVGDGSTSDLLSSHIKKRPGRAPAPRMPKTMARISTSSITAGWMWRPFYESRHGCMMAMERDERGCHADVRAAGGVCTGHPNPRTGQCAAWTCTQGARLPCMPSSLHPPCHPLPSPLFPSMHPLSSPTCMHVRGCIGEACPIRCVCCAVHAHGFVGLESRNVR